MPSAITDKLLQGSWPQDMSQAYQHADVIVFCAQERPPPDHVVPPGKRLFYIPYDDTHDLRVVPIVDLQKLAKRLAEEIHAGKRVLVTCAMGLNRSGLLTALTLGRAYGMSGEQAVQRVRDRRPGALRNGIFARLARDLIDGRR